MATYTLTTTTARQDAALAYCAQKAGAADANAWVQAQFGRLVQRAINDRDRDDAAAVGQAYVGATPAVQGQIKTALGL